MRCLTWGQRLHIALESAQGELLILDFILVNTFISPNPEGDLIVLRLRT
jgi:hypothetical protein